MPLKKALVLFSGGQDSTACLLLAQKLFDEVHTISFEYGQKHDLPSNQLRVLSKKLGALSHRTIELFQYAQWTTSDLFDKEDTQASTRSESNLPQTFVPGRNLVFLNIAAIHAYQDQIDHIILGVSQVDFSGYPDCREKFIVATENAIQCAFDKKIKIFAPLIYMNKSEIWAIINALSDLKEIEQETKTCYAPGKNHQACRICAACQLRIQGLEGFLQSPEEHLKHGINSLEKSCINLKLRACKIL